MSARQWAVLAHFCGQPQRGSVWYSQRTTSSQLLQQCWLIEAAQLAKACSSGDQTVQQPRLVDCTDAFLPIFRAPACSPSRALLVQSSIFNSVLSSWIRSLTSRPADCAVLACPRRHGTLKQTRLPRAFLDWSKRYVADIWSYFH